MAKGKVSVYFCNECGYESTKWMGQCPACKEWNTFVEEKVEKKSAKTTREISEVKTYSISEIEDADEIGRAHV